MGWNVAYRPELVPSSSNRLIRPNVGAFSLGGVAPSSSTIVSVSNISQLMAAIDAANLAGGNRTILVAPGTYTIPNGFALVPTAPNIKIRSSTNVAADVIIRGDAMSGSAQVPYNVNVRAAYFELSYVTLAGLCQFSCLQIAGEVGAHYGWVHDCILKDSFEHLVKGTGNPIGWVIERNTMFFTAGRAPAQYNGGIDIHGATSCFIQDNLIRDVASPITSACQHAINIWNGSNNTIIQRNRVIDCDRGIGDGLFGLAVNTDNTIRNNTVYHSNNGDQFADVGISTENTLNGRVHNNTVYFENSFPWCMEYRYVTTGSEYLNNLTNKQILARDGAVAFIGNNVTNAQATWFQDLAAGDLRLNDYIGGVYNAGDPIATVTDDLYRTSRPQGLGYDIGAHEYVPLPEVPPTALMQLSGKAPVVSSISPLIRPVTGAIAATAYPPTPASPLNLPLATDQNLSITYLGFFATPSTADYGGAAMSISPDGTQLYMTGNAQEPRMVRLSNPGAGGGTATAQIGVTAISGTVGSGTGTQITGSLVYNGELYITASLFYDADATQNLWIKKANLSIGGQGVYNSMNAGGVYPRRLSQQLMHIPSLWQGTLGGPAAVLGSRHNIITNACCGLGFGVFNPANVASSTASVTVVPLLDYYAGTTGNSATAIEPVQGHHTAYASFPKNANGGTDLFSVTFAPLCCAFIAEGSRSLIYVYMHGYGGGDNGCRPGSSVHNDPNRLQMVAYDLRELVRVKNGEIAAYVPRPYNFDATNGRNYLPVPGAPFGTCMGNPTNGNGHGCGVYDPVTRRLYINGGLGESTSERRIHVWQIGQVS